MDLTVDFLESVFIKTKLKTHYQKILLNSITEYQQIFTAPSINELYNYELYEHLGDATANDALVWYLYRRFPQLHCPTGVKVLARLKINYVSSESWSEIANDLGFWPFIKANYEERNSLEKKQKLLEDVFEAFIGLTKDILDTKFTPGVGNGIIYTFIETLFSTKDISLQSEDLFDAKTKLKELFDLPYIREHFGIIKYYHKDGKTELYFEKNNLKNLYGTGYGNTHVAQEKDAANQALKSLKEKGYSRDKKFQLFCD